MDCFMGMKFDDSQIVKVMDTYEDLVAEFGGDDGLALSVACNEVEFGVKLPYRVNEDGSKSMDNSYLAMEITHFDTDTLKKVRKRKMVVRPWWSREFMEADTKYFDEDMRKCEKCGDWEKYFNMSYDDSLGEHYCEDCEDSDDEQNDIEQIGGWAYSRLKCKEEIGCRYNIVGCQYNSLLETVDSPICRGCSNIALQKD